MKRLGVVVIVRRRRNVLGLSLLHGRMLLLLLIHCCL
jgi:hypothetical protein